MIPNKYSVPTQKAVLLTIIVNMLIYIIYISKCCQAWFVDSAKSHFEPNPAQMTFMIILTLLFIVYTTCYIIIRRYQNEINWLGRINKFFNIESCITLFLSLVVWIIVILNTYYGCPICGMNV